MRKYSLGDAMATGKNEVVIPELEIDGPDVAGDRSGTGQLRSLQIRQDSFPDLDGVDTVDGRKAYRLSLKLPNGGERKMWIDVKTNLDIRLDRPATNPLKPGAPVSVYYRDYADADGIQVARSIETGVGTGQGDKLVIDRVLVNPKLDDGTFALPPTPMRRGGHVRIPGP